MSFNDSSRVNTGVLPQYWTRYAKVLACPHTHCLCHWSAYFSRKTPLAFLLARCKRQGSRKQLSRMLPSQSVLCGALVKVWPAGHLRSICRSNKRLPLSVMRAQEGSLKHQPNKKLRHRDCEPERQRASDNNVEHNAKGQTCHQYF